MMMKRTIGITAGLVLALGVAAGPGNAAPAEKAATSKRCPAQAVCVWTNKNFRGQRLVITKKGVTNLPPAFNNQVSSIKARYTVPDGGFVFLHDKKDANGEFRCFGEGSFKKARNLATEGWSFDNRATSVLLPAHQGPNCAF